jgi:hypothetical protein
VKKMLISSATRIFVSRPPESQATHPHWQLPCQAAGVK